TVMLAGASVIFCSNPAAVTTTASKSTGAGAGAGAATTWADRPRASAQVSGERRSRLRREEVGMMSSFKVAWGDLVGGAGAGWRPARTRRDRGAGLRRAAVRARAAARRRSAQGKWTWAGAWTRWISRGAAKDGPRRENGKRESLSNAIATSPEATLDAGLAVAQLLRPIVRGKRRVPTTPPGADSPLAGTRAMTPPDRRHQRAHALPRSQATSIPVVPYPDAPIGGPHREFG